jgi:hypothetical protein
MEAEQGARDNKGAEMLRGDLEAAGIPYAVEGPDGPLFADFHALRHTYLTLGGRAGIDLRTLQELAGHSSSTLTERYSHRRLYDLQGAVEKLPNFLPEKDAPRAESLRATGTEGQTGQAESSSGCGMVAQENDSERESVRGNETTEEEEDEDADGPNPCNSQELRPSDTERDSLRLAHLAGLEPATFGSVDERESPYPLNENPDFSSILATVGLFASPCVRLRKVA